LQVKLWLIVNCGLISSTQATSSRKMDNDPSGAYLLPVQTPYGLHPSCYNNEGEFWTLAVVNSQFSLQV
jgi:hypothetical protein